jgi:hypothetical protein
MQPGRRPLATTLALAAFAACGVTGPPPSTGLTTTPMQTEPSRAATTEPPTTSTATASTAIAQSTTTTSEISPQSVALDLVARIRSADDGDLTEAAASWSGYPYLESEHLSRFTAWVDANPWLRDGTVRFDVVPAWSQDPALAMSVVAITDVDWRGTTAILVDREGGIQRIQVVDPFEGPVRVTGGTVAIPFGPTEGGVSAYLSYRLLDQGLIKVTEAHTVIIQLPNGGPEEAEVLVVSMATPELPTALAVLVGND